MRLPPTARSILGIAALVLVDSGTAHAGRPLVATAPLPGRNFPTDAELAAFLEPRPPASIPDDPPPHEGAMFDLSHVIDAPDLIVVEVLEALPGRPITGERLVRPDGTISLGFYGEVHVRGLTAEQAKVKILLHLRKFMPDDTLGLFKVIGEEEVPVPAPSEPAASPLDPGPPSMGPPDAPKSKQGAVRSGRRPGALRIGEGPSPPRVKPLTAPRRTKEQEGAARGEAPPSTETIPQTGTLLRPPLDPPPFLGEGAMVMAIHPADSDRIFVDTSAYNSNFYYVQGDVASPGRMPSTGRETVLDAINYGGGLIATAEPRDIRLVRPGRAGKPPRILPVDLEAITRSGDATHNYQVFPGDRIVVGRNAVVKSAIEIDRIAQSLQSAMNSMLTSSLLMRSLAQSSANGTMSGAPISVRIKLGDLTWVFDAGGKVPELTPAQREAILKPWVDFWWKVASKPGGVTLDESNFREALMRALNPTVPPAPAEKK